MTPAFVLKNHVDQLVCPTCNRAVKSWATHRRSTRCRRYANRALVREGDLTRLSFKDAKCLREAEITITKLNEGDRRMAYFGPRWAAEFVDLLLAASYTEAAIIAVLRSSPADRERERALVALLPRSRKGTR